MSTTRTGNGIFEIDNDALIPLSRTDNGFIYSSLAYNYRDVGNSNFSGGIGYRFDIPNLDAVAGLRAHVDVSKTPLNNQAEQLGLGFDFFTAFGVEAYGNVYLPSSGIDSGAPFARQHSILQLQEGSRKGGDLRVSTPIPFLTRILSPRAFAGAYFFDSQFSVDDLSGVNAGVEVSPFCGVKFGAEYYDDKEFYGSNWNFKAVASVPTDSLLDVLRPRAWARIFQPRSNGACTNDIMAFRVLQPAPRRNWVTTETQINSLASNVIFVNNGGPVGNGIMAGSAGGTGTAENPVDTIQGGVTALASQLGGSGMVYVQAGTYGSAADQNIEAGHGAGAGVSDIVFTSSHQPISAGGGQNFGGNTGRALISNGGFDIRGGSAGDTNSVQIQGFEIVGGITNNPTGNVFPGDGIGLTEVANATINGNMIRGVSSNGISNEGVFNGTIRDNTIMNNGGNGIVLETNNGNITANTISSNTLSGVQIRTANGANAIISANTISSNGSQGIEFFQSDNDGAVTGNTITGNGRNGIDFFQSDNNGIVSNNIISSNGDNGIDFFQGNGNAGVIRGNILTANGEDGIEFFQSTNLAAGTVDANVATGNTEHGFSFDNPNVGTFINNVANNNGLLGYDGVGIGGVANTNNTGAGNTGGGNTPQ